MLSSNLKRSVVTLGVVAGVLAAAVPAGAAPAASHAYSDSAGAVVVLIGANDYGLAQSQGIIMRDGGVCDPIRHMGC
jgi:hypothetical protein